MIKVKKYIVFIGQAVILIFSLFGVLEAQEINENLPIDCSGDKIEYSEESKEVRILGHSVITHDDIKITAEEVIVYPETKDVYAAGDVTLYKGEDVFEADKVYYNFGNKKGSLMHGDFASGKVFGETERLEKLSEKELNAIKGYFTTCNLNPPHYRIEARNIKIYLEDKIVAKNVLFYVGNFPLLYFPYYSYSLREDKPKVVIIPGHSKEWGYFLLTSWRYFFNERSRGWIHFDWRDKLGFGEGIDYEYNTEKYGKGLLKLYYTQERKRGLREDEPAEKDKYRVKLEHGWKIDNDTEALLEYHKYKDEKFIKDYFYKEYVKDPQPTSYFSITRNKAHYSLRFLARKRVNHFRTIVETLPEVKLNINNYRLGNSRLYYTSDFRFDNFNIKEAYTGEDTDAVRLHADNKFSYPTKLIGYLDWIDFTPYVGHIETFYSKDKYGTDRNFFRGLWYSGYTLSTKIYRVFDVDGEYLNVEVNKLRHLITPSIDYVYRHEPTAIADKMGQFDDVDAYAKAKYYVFALENKLQTKWFKEGTFDKENIDLVSLRSSVNFYPQIEGHQFSNVTTSLTLQPKRWLDVTLTNTYNPYTDDFEIFNTEVEAEKSKWRVKLGSRYYQQTQFHEGTIKATYTLSPKWTLGFYERYDLDGNNLVEQEYALTRDLHCWTAEIIWNIQEGETIWLVFKPKAFPDFPLEFVTSYHVPKIGSQSEEDW